ncbi:ABC transporter permease [Actinocrispum wychmicini]|uniref:Peptide/nickel transport system permease protein n=1 Tax=Actinocrispum wychmicini TaxID=1213861 RepID=A0A4R2JPA3_9PSEU|nr:ABC transporter permease [Actinocrispum wychmicini]TCO58569.1 peptide/nickel transport system permease protein [Actinocrispum wychmicini]
MFRYIIRRILITIPLLIVGSFLVFALVQAMGDPLGEWRLLPPPKSPEQIAAALNTAGYNKPFFPRYLDWLGSFVTGDWKKGVVPGSSAFGRDVKTEVFHGLGNTARLVIGAEILALTLGMAIGVLGAVRQYSLTDYAVTGWAFVMFSMPVFCLGLMLKSVAIPLNDWFESLGTERWLVTAGPPPGGFSGSVGHQIVQYIGVFLLPTLTLLCIQFALYSRFQRASMLDVLNQDYVRTAQAKGLSQSRVVFRHAYRNGLIPVLTVFAVNFGTLITGAVITETVFGWSGMGKLLIRSITDKEPYMVLGVVMVTAISIVFFNLLADILYARLDPRIRLG